MRKQGIMKKFLVEMMVLGFSVVLLWTIFYSLTIQIMKKNMIAQAQTSAGAIISSVENVLLEIEETAYRLSHSKEVAAMMEAKDLQAFYDRGGIAEESYENMIGQNVPAGNVLIIRNDGNFYRLKGRIANTAIKKVHAILLQNGSRNFTVISNGMTYVGCSHVVYNEQEKEQGYVVLLMEKTRLESIFGDFNKLKHLGFVLMTNENVLCANQKIELNDLDERKKKSEFYEEQSVGFTGIRLLVFGDSMVSVQVKQYFIIALPITILLLIFLMYGFVSYWKKHMIAPINSVIAHTSQNTGMPLPLTGEEYFDGLVNHVNEMLYHIEENEKKLYESQMRVKDIELENERTILTLLKKQINAHFTVNTLNTVRAFIHKGEQEDAAKLCNELSGLLRYAHGGGEQIMLLEEMHVLEQYVTIMQTRYPGKFQYVSDIDEELLEVMIPRMLLQPIVENAIVHGLADRTGEISIRAELGDKLRIQVMDNGRGMEEEELRKLQDSITRKSADDRTRDGIHHIALMNIDRRIKMVYGEEYGLRVESEKEHGTCVTVEVGIR